MIEALEDMEEGVPVERQLVSDVRFADNQGMVAGTEIGLQRLMNKFNDTAKNFDMKINVQKTKTMVVRWDGGRVVNITVDGKRIQQVKNFKYLGSVIIRKTEEVTVMKKSGLRWQRMHSIKGKSC